MSDAAATGAATAPGQPGRAVGAIETVGPGNAAAIPPGAAASTDVMGERERVQEQLGGWEEEPL